jgi:hypothetical protein
VALEKNNEPGKYQARLKRREINEAIVFGGLAIMDVLGTSLDPWLCVPGFHRVYYYRSAILLLCKVSIGRSGGEVNVLKLQ